MLTLKKPYAAAVATLLMVAGYALGTLTAGESCDTWTERYTDALMQSRHATIEEERQAPALILAQRPAGCE